MRCLNTAISGCRRLKFTTGNNKKMFSSSHGEASGAKAAPVETALVSTKAAQRGLVVDMALGDPSVTFWRLQREALDFCSYIDQSADQVSLSCQAAKCRFAML
jgi:hypothetical protein